MLFNSIEFIIFFPIVAVLYFLIPKKYRYLWLLAASYYFYMKWEVKYVLLLFFSTAITYLCGILIDKIESGELPDEKKVKGKKLCVAGSLFLNFGVLVYFKYLNFLIDSWNKLAGYVRLNISFSGNKCFNVPMEEHGVCRVVWRENDDAVNNREIEIGY